MTLDRQATPQISPDPDRRRPTWGERFYRHRGLLPVPPALLAVATAAPRPVLVVIGGTLMVLGEGIRLWGAAHLGLTARSSTPRAGKLVTTGPYARTRHPLYWGNLTLVVGFATVSGAIFPWLGLVVVGLYLVLYVGHARREEALLARAFPEAYATYAAQVSRFAWRRRPAEVPGAGKTGSPGWKRALRVEARTLILFFCLLVALWFRTALV